MQELQDIYRLQAFVTVVETGSLSRAVNKLYITQPALSTRLRLLEESLGCTLLERDSRGVRPTAMGKLVYDMAKDILKRVSLLQLKVKNHLELSEGWVHLGGDATAISGIFPEAIAHFRKKYPNIQFTLHEKTPVDALEALQSGVLDIGILSLPQKEDLAIKIHGEIEDTLVIIAGREHPFVTLSSALSATGKNLLPMHISHQALILPEAGNLLRDVIDREFRRVSVRPQTIMTLHNAQNIIKMVAQNIGLGIVSALELAEHPLVEPLAVEGVSFKYTLQLCTPATRTFSPAAEKFLNFLLTFGVYS